MDDDNSKEENQPSTSKKESKSVNSGDDLYDDRGQDEPVTNSESSISATYSARSRLDIADARPDIPKPPTGKVRDQKPSERKKKGRRPTGRVDKRRRSTTRRHVVRRIAKRRPKFKEERKGRDLSISTIFTRLSSTGSRSPGCEQCGHRCCRRRFEEAAKIEAKKKRRRPRKVRREKERRTIEYIAGRMSGLECNQVGSASKMLSPLFVNTSSLPKPDETAEDERRYCEITPAIIHEALQRLTKWRQHATTSSIMEDIKKNYPVNPEQDSLLKELKEKLRIAAVVGIITRISEDCWCLQCVIENRNLSESHVTRFWQAYGDTMKPVTKKELDEDQKQEQLETQTNTSAKKTVCSFSQKYI